jgi:cytochrome bd ubiquinol oxidase subunit I
LGLALIFCGVAALVISIWQYRWMDHYLWDTPFRPIAGMTEDERRMGLVMLAVSWLGNLLRFRGRLETTRWLLWCTFLSFPSGFIAILAGWYTAEVGRQPWAVYGLLRTADAVTPSPTTGEALFSLLGYVLVYAVFVLFGTYYIYRLLLRGPAGEAAPIANATASRPMAFADDAASATGAELPGRSS